MKKTFSAGSAFLLLLALTCASQAQEIRRDRIRFEKPRKDPVLQEMTRRDRKLRREEEKKTRRILERLKKEWKSPPRLSLRPDTSDLPRPAGPKAFHQAWHLPPVPQYLSGTCWDFAGTSFMESEIKRLTGKEIKLSEMWTAYWEYVEKAKGFLRSRGTTVFGQGSEANAVPRIYSLYGVVPASAYKGVLAPDGRIDHDPMFSRLRSFLSWCKDQGVWDEKFVIPLVRRILDETMGRPPEEFEWQGKTYTPKEFLGQVCRIRPEDYVALLSTLSDPFWTRTEFRVPDNWWHDKSYVNVPLDVWYGALLSALKKGYTAVFGGDVSEPGYYGKENIAYVPTFDIPYSYIDQAAREFRIYEHLTTDDHGVHVVGWTRFRGHDWFLIKDSARSSRWGPFKGYYMYRDGYVKLKMLTFLVHKDAVKGILERLAAKRKEEEKKKKKKSAGPPSPRKEARGT